METRLNFFSSTVKGFRREITTKLKEGGKREKVSVLGRKTKRAKGTKKRKKKKPPRGAEVDWFKKERRKTPNGPSHPYKYLAS